MMNLKQLLKKPLKPISNRLIFFLLLVALLGFIDSSYLTIEHFQNSIPPCSLISGCEEVLTSPYSVFLGIPVALLGAIFYLFILIAGSSYIVEGKKDLFIKTILIISFLGFVFSLWFVFVQAFILKAYCMYCLGSFLTSTMIFLFSTRVIYLNRN